MAKKHQIWSRATRQAAGRSWRRANKQSLRNQIAVSQEKPNTALWRIWKLVEDNWEFVGEFTLEQRAEKDKLLQELKEAGIKCKSKSFKFITYY